MATSSKKTAMAKSNVIGYLPNDQPPPLQMVLLGFQHVLTMFPATVLVAALCGFHVGTVLTVSGVGTSLPWCWPNGDRENLFRYSMDPALAISPHTWRLPSK